MLFSVYCVLTIYNLSNKSTIEKLSVFLRCARMYTLYLYLPFSGEGGWKGN